MSPRNTILQLSTLTPALSLKTPHHPYFEILLIYCSMVFCSSRDHFVYVTCENSLLLGEYCDDNLYSPIWLVESEYKYKYRYKYRINIWIIIAVMTGVLSDISQRRLRFLLLLILLFVNFLFGFVRSTCWIFIFLIISPEPGSNLIVLNHGNWITNYNILIYNSVRLTFSYLCSL